MPSSSAVLVMVLSIGALLLPSAFASDVCDLPADSGECKGVFLRFFHNPLTAGCEPFIYGGCGGNGNNFKTLLQCHNQCACPDGSSPVQCFIDPCDVASCPNHPNAVCVADYCGGCNARFFDSTTGDELTDTCTYRDVCSLPADPGPCEALIPRYFHNATAGECQGFTYGGCEGNENNFESLLECQEKCTVCPFEGQVFTSCGTACPLTCSDPSPPPFCTLQCVVGCQCPPGTLLDEVANKCVETADQCTCPDPVQCLIDPCEVASCPNHPKAVCVADYCGGCIARFFDRMTGEELTDTCKAEDVCDLPADPGECDGVFLRFFHNPLTAGCEPFIYGGCGGNGNNFETLLQCHNQCACPDGSLPVQCLIDPCEVTSCPNHPNAVCVADYCGGCNARFFDSTTGDELTDTCTYRDVCSLPADPGPCKALIPRYFHNATAGECQGFTYGGCEGNENNFESLLECQEKCTVCPIEGQVFTSCGTACPLTCSDPSPPPFCTLQCVVGCQCPPGTLLDEVANKCVETADQCTCPPTCSKKFCLHRKNRKAKCSVPFRDIPGCTGQCQVTFCTACYFSEETRPLPTGCSDCGSPISSERCLESWAKCIHWADRLEHGRTPYSCKTEEKFKCYRYPCQLKG